MKVCITKMQTYVAAKPRLKQWLWFVALWFAGLLIVTALTYPLKVLVRLAAH